MKTNEEKTGYKAIYRDKIQRDLTYNTDEGAINTCNSKHIKLCESGLHFYKSPFRTHDYISPVHSKAYKVKAIGPVDENDIKCTCRYLKIIKELSTKDIVSECVEYAKKNKKIKRGRLNKDKSHYHPSYAKDMEEVACSMGAESLSISYMPNSIALTYNNTSVSNCFRSYSIAYSEGNRSISVSNHTHSISECNGIGSVAMANGSMSIAQVNKINSVAITNSMKCTAIANSPLSVAVSSPYYSKAIANKKGSVAIAMNKDSGGTCLLKGVNGSMLIFITTKHEIEAFKVGENGIKENTWYSFREGIGLKEEYIKEHIEDL